MSLARSLYSNADVYMLDDPLSAVDSHVGKSIFDLVIGPSGMLKGKTRLFVTNSLNFLPQVDEIIMLDEGFIVETGTYDQLKDKNGTFTEFMKAFLEANEANQEFIRNISLERQASIISEKFERSLSIVSKKSEIKEKPQRKLVEMEKIETGNVKIRTIIEYFKACRLWLSFLFFSLYILSYSVDMRNRYWLSDWSNDALDNNNTFFNNTSSNDTYPEKYNKFYRLTVYIILGFTKSLIEFITDLTFVYMFIKATERLHNKLLYCVLRSDLKFFETTPNGRIVNRFTKDIEATEDSIPYSVKTLIDYTLSLLTTIIIISSATPYILLALLPIIIAYILLQRYFIPSNRQLKRMLSASKSPIFAHFSESQAGVMTIRAYKLTDRFIKTMEDNIDYSFRSSYAISSSNRYDKHK